MKKIILLLFVSVIALGVSAQTVVLKDGLYYNNAGALYTGEYIVNFESGAKKSVVNIVEGKVHGAVTYYYENGNIMETGAFASNEKNGEWLRWDEAGNKIAQAFYVSGKKDGIWLVWDASGVKRYEMVYAMGEKVGKWSMWDENGKLMSEKSYATL